MSMWATMRMDRPSIVRRVLSASSPAEPGTRCSLSGSCPRIAHRSWAFRRRGPADSAVRPALHLGAHAVSPARLRRGAAVAVEYLTTLGTQATIVETGGHPLVVGGWIGNPAWPTVAVYNHLDVQPAIEPEWTREPFKFAVEGEHYYGRGATDDKGPALTALLAARYAVEHGVRLNIQFVWELEEEIGSP